VGALVRGLAAEGYGFFVIGKDARLAPVSAEALAGKGHCEVLMRRG
jgi:hypothetical protein